MGIPTSFGRFSAAARDMGAPALISANALRRKGRPFNKPSAGLFSGVCVALDSAGFVAQSLYGGYPWTVEEYVELAGSYPWAWWASMDYCCEKEVAAGAAEVRERQKKTVEKLAQCRAEAERRGVTPPMPCLQGWLPDDYMRCADMIGELPALVGVGSVCRRQLGGPDGLLTVVEYLDLFLPAHVKFHLFGVKGDALPHLQGFNRIASVDSMAWDMAAMHEARKLRRILYGDAGGRVPDDAPTVYTVDFRIEHMRRWYFEQTAPLRRMAA